MTPQDRLAATLDWLTTDADTRTMYAERQLAADPTIAADLMQAPALRKANDDLQDQITHIKDVAARTAARESALKAQLAADLNDAPRLRAALLDVFTMLTDKQEAQLQQETLASITEAGLLARAALTEGEKQYDCCGECNTKTGCGCPDMCGMDNCDATGAVL